MIPAISQNLNSNLNNVKIPRPKLPRKVGLTQNTDAYTPSFGSKENFVVRLVKAFSSNKTPGNIAELPVWAKY